MDARKNHPLFATAKQIDFCHEGEKDDVSCAIIHRQFSPFSSSKCQFRARVYSLLSKSSPFCSVERWRSGFALCNPVVTFCSTFSLSLEFVSPVKMAALRNPSEPNQHTNTFLFPLLYAAAIATATEFYRSIEFFAREQRHSTAILLLSYL